MGKVLNIYLMYGTKIIQVVMSKLLSSRLVSIRLFKYYLRRYNLISFTTGKFTEINRHGQKKSTYSGINITWATHLSTAVAWREKITKHFGFSHIFLWY